MNTKDLTPKQIQAIRIAVAEVAGWRLIPANRSWPKDYYKRPSDNACCAVDELPNYPADLNAVHEVEETIVRDGYQWTMYRTKALERVCLASGGTDAVHATALQRCIALLMTLAPDKWEVIKANP